MAGRGSRFVQAGYSVPKPLINVLGRPMYSWAVDGLPLNESKQLIFICLREHLESLELERDIRSRYAKYKPIIVPLAHVTEGQACTVLKAREWIDNDDPLLIFNADTYCPTTIGESLKRWGPEVDGALDVFEGEGDKWSFARIDEQGRVQETAEKKRISPWASTGLYYFRRGKDFVQHATHAIAESARHNNEFYVAPLYNRMIAAGGEVRINLVDRVHILGTPEDLAHFLHLPAEYSA
jgi:dTDP-glucose pyrophosphorylase